VVRFDKGGFQLLGRIARVHVEAAVGVAIVRKTATGTLVLGKETCHLVLGGVALPAAFFFKATLARKVGDANLRARSGERLVAVNTIRATASEPILTDLHAGLSVGSRLEVYTPVVVDVVLATSHDCDMLEEVLVSTRQNWKGDIRLIL
jgi:hypothetical protein